MSIGEADFETVLERLRGSLNATIVLLDGHGERAWADWLRTALRRLGGYDPAAFEQLLGGFGGMGSFSDLVVCAGNGHTIARADEGAVNRRLDELRRSIRRDAEWLRHEVRRPGESSPHRPARS